MEFQRIKNIIESYNDPYKPEIQFLLGTIFTFDSHHKLTELFCDRYYVVTLATKDKVYYRRLYAQIYHPTWESKPLSQNHDSIIFNNTPIIRTKYVFKYNENLMNDLNDRSLTIDEFNSNTICFKSSEIYEIICDYNLINIKLSTKDKNNLSTNDKNILKSIQTFHEKIWKKRILVENLKYNTIIYGNQTRFCYNYIIWI